jgi:hypothetical protein
MNSAEQIAPQQSPFINYVLPPRLETGGGRTGVSVVSRLTNPSKQ